MTFIYKLRYIMYVFIYLLMYLFILFISKSHLLKFLACFVGWI